jgi:serine-type D-Ala-D-Ala carboxypeptidase (penicillin-binding protein 5/6)
MRPGRIITTTMLALFALAGFVSNAPAQTPAPAAPPPPAALTTAAPVALLIDAASGAVLFEKNADQQIAPASLAKLMTMEVVFRALADGKLKLEDEIRISENAWRKGGAPSGTSTMYAEVNSLVRVQDLITGAIVQSANDACIALAEHVAGGEAAFAGRMTTRAREIGMARSTFTNPTGLPDPEQRVTARELAILARHIQTTYPEHYRIYGQREFTWNKIRQFNRNPLLAMGIGADGMKTGFTTESGYALVGTAVQRDLRLIVVLSGMKTERERADEGRRVLDWGFRTFENRIVFAAGEAVGEVAVHGGTRSRLKVHASAPVALLLARGGLDRLAGRIEYDGPLAAPVAAGAPVGRLRIDRDGSPLIDVPLVAAEPVGQGTMMQRAEDGARWLFGLPMAERAP